MSIFIRSFSFVLCFLLLSHFVDAQAPGYKGKKVILSANSNISYDPFFGRYKNGFFFKFGVQSEFVLAKNFSLGLSYIQYSTKFPDYIDNYYSSSMFPGLNTKTLTSYSYNLDIYQYTKGSTAPLGTFIRYQVFYMTSVSEDFYEDMGPEYSFSPIDFSNAGVSITVGRKRIFADIISLSYGLKFGYTFLGMPFMDDVLDESPLQGYGRSNNFLSMMIG